MCRALIRELSVECFARVALPAAARAAGQRAAGVVGEGLLVKAFCQVKVVCCEPFDARQSWTVCALGTVGQWPRMSLGSFCTPGWHWDRLGVFCRHPLGHLFLRLAGVGHIGHIGTVVVKDICLLCGPLYGSGGR